MQQSFRIFQQQIEEALQQTSAQLPASPAGLYDPIRYSLLLGGKRMRPLLVLIGCRLFSEKTEQAIAAAVGIELFHNFTLLHDDIMDNAPLRRSHPTVHAKWNTNIAILSGDAMLVEAYREIAKSPAQVMPAVLELFSRTALEVCEGQQLDMDFEKAANVSISDYLGMIELKTAVLLAASLKTGALCGGASETDAQSLYEFGRQVGLAFQLQDDILDVYGDAQKFGKQTGGDIISNKKTYLLLKAFELADRYRKEELNNWLSAPPEAAEEKVKAVTAIYDYLGVHELAREELKLHYNAGIAHLEAVNADAHWKKMLRDFTDSLMVREA